MSLLIAIAYRTAVTASTPKIFTSLLHIGEDLSNISVDSWFAEKISEFFLLERCSVNLVELSSY